MIVWGTITSQGVGKQEFINERMNTKKFICILYSELFFILSMHRLSVAQSISIMIRNVQRNIPRSSY